MARPDQEDVALLHPHSLAVLRFGEVTGQHAVARLQPADPASPRDVEQDTPADQPVLQRLDRFDRAHRSAETESAGRPL